MLNRPVLGSMVVSIPACHAADRRSIACRGGFFVVVSSHGVSLRYTNYFVYIITWVWRKLHNEELRDFYFLPNIVQVIKSRRMWWVEHVARMVEGRGVHRVLVEKLEGKRTLGRPRRRWEYNIKMDLQ